MKYLQLDYMMLKAKIGLPLAYIPAERPVFGREAYKKLVPWREHCTLMKSVVRTGVRKILN
ncbi:hypothetical protein B7O87_03430 [Cylindrospermopsis raciborskii CENA303]|uniref:Uncharacterized protein n=2 Tax=Cylindrospermopsis raciborskii TaxID=77022 RepID=A0A1X4GAS2_9CYAN|nr:hypothetical protein B7O87_03430 [Cylindrospermopsis raciborskii CENA303]